MRRSGLALILCAATVALALGAATTPLAAQSAPTEYQLKAVFLFHFAQFTEWPASAFPEPGAPLVIGILGEDPFGSYLDETVRGETVKGHPLVVRRYRPGEEITTAHILFVSRSEQERLEPVLDRLQGRPILTVGDTERFAGRGGMVQFVSERQRIRLRIDLAAVESGNLKLSSKLLRPAEIVATARKE